MFADYTKNYKSVKMQKKLDKPTIEILQELSGQNVDSQRAILTKHFKTGVPIQKALVEMASNPTKYGGNSLEDLGFKSIGAYDAFFYELGANNVGVCVMEELRDKGTYRHLYTNDGNN